MSKTRFHLQELSFHFFCFFRKVISHIISSVCFFVWMRAIFLFATPSTSIQNRILRTMNAILFSHSLSLSRHTNAKIVYKIRVELYLPFKFICFWFALVCLFLVSFLALFSLNASSFSPAPRLALLAIRQRLIQLLFYHHFRPLLFLLSLFSA